MMAADELRALGEDIKANGLRVPIVFIETVDGRAVVDGRNRLDAMEIHGLYWTSFKLDHVYLPENADAYAYVLSANIHRRHLTAEQKNELTAKVLKANPEQSNRQIAEQVKRSPTTVGAVRRKLEATDQIGQLQKTVGKDGKARPTTKPKQDEATVEKPGDTDLDDLEIPGFLRRSAMPAEQKSKAVTVDIDRLRREAEALQQLVHEADDFSSAEEFVLFALREDRAEAFLPLILAALNVPEPQPDLTRADIDRASPGLRIINREPRGFL